MTGQTYIWSHNTQFMRTIILTISLIAFILSESNGQTPARITGTVKDGISGDVLTGATVHTDARSTVTNYDGGFNLELMPGVHLLKISFVGYDAQEMEVKVNEQGIVDLMVNLQPAAHLLETATVTTGRFERPLGETTVSLELIKPRFIEQVNAVRLDEALNRLPGVNMIDGQANIRGGSGFSYGAGSRVMLLVDDIPALQADAGYPNWGDMAIENMEQVEVLKGAASALYGSAALNGIVNVRSAFAKSTPFTKATAFFTAYLDPSDPVRKWWGNGRQPYSTGASVTHRQKFGKLDMAGSLFLVNTESFVKDAYDKQGRINLGLRYRLTDRLAIGMNSNVNVGSSQSFFLWGNDKEGAYLGGGDNNNSQSDKVRFFIDPYLNYYDKGGNRHKVLGRIYSIDNDNSLNQSNRSSLVYTEYQFQRNFSSANLVLTAGAVATFSRISAELYSDTTFTSRNMAGYVQLEKKFFKWLTLTAGARLENNYIRTPDSIGGARVPQNLNEETLPVFRAGANARLSPFTFLRGSWGQGYRFPTIAEKFINTDFSSFRVIPNLQLGSETGWTAEIGLRQGMKFGSWNGYLDLAGFWSEYRDMMEFSFVGLAGFPPAFSFQSQNIGNTVIRGVEVNWTGQGTLFGLPFNMFAGYMHIDPRYKNFGQKENDNSSADYNVLKYRFRNSWKLDIEMPITRRLSAGYSFQYNSPMEAIDGIFTLIPGVYEFRQANNKGFHVMDVRAGYRFGRIFEAWVILKNATNQAYSVRPAQLDPPRNITLRLAMTLQ